VGDLERDNDNLKAELERLKRKLGELEPRLQMIADLEG
jgi:hypothetical protein